MIVKLSMFATILLVGCSTCNPQPLSVVSPADGQFLSDESVTFEVKKDEKECDFVGPFNATLNPGQPNEADITEIFNRPPNSDVWTSSPYPLSPGKYTLLVQGKFNHRYCDGEVVFDDSTTFDMGGNPSQCKYGEGRFNYSEGSAVLPFNEVPLSGNEFVFAYLRDNGTLSNSFSPDHVGFAFYMGWISESPGFPIPVPERIAGRYFVFQYDIPDFSCPQRFRWSASPEIQFPSGYLIMPEPGAGSLIVEMFGFVDSSLDRLVEHHTRVSESNDSQAWTFWEDPRNSGDNVKVANSISGVADLALGHSYKLYVVVSFTIRAIHGAGCGAVLTSIEDSVQDLRESAIIRDRDVRAATGPTFTFEPL